MINFPPKTSQALALAIGLSLSLANAPNPGTTLPASAVGAIKITVVSSDGQPLAKMPVELRKPPKRIALPPPGTPGPSPKTTQPLALQNPYGELVAAAETDAKGVALLDKVPPGTYRLASARKDVGRAVQTVTVEAAKTLEVQLTLSK